MYQFDTADTHVADARNNHSGIAVDLGSNHSGIAALVDLAAAAGGTSSMQIRRAAHYERNKR